MYRSWSALASKERAVGSCLKQIRSKNGWTRAYSLIELQTEKKDRAVILEQVFKERKDSQKDVVHVKNKVAVVDSGIRPVIVEGAMFREWCKAVAADTLKMSINEAEAKIKSKAGVIGRSDGGESELGMKLDSGYLSPHFVTDQKSQKCELKDPLVFIYDKKIYNTDAVEKLMELASNRPLLIVAEDLGSDALGNLVLSKLSTGVKVCAVKAPGLGDNRKASLQNLANITGGDIVSQDLETEYGSLVSDVFGTCKKVMVSKGETFIFEGAGAKKPTTEKTAEEEDIELVKMHSSESEFLLKYLLKEEAKMEKRQAEKLNIVFKRYAPEVRKKRRRSSAKVTRGKQKS